MGQVVAKRFRDRSQAGQDLCKALARYRGDPNVMVLGLVRGGVPIGFEVARCLEAPLDALIVKKVGVPRHPELAMGAVAVGGVTVRNNEVIEQLQIPDSLFESAARKAAKKLTLSNKRIRNNAPWPKLASKTVIITDDGIATGSTMIAAIEAVREQNPLRLIVAAPVIPPDTAARLQQLVDEIAYCQLPKSLGAVGAWYEDFTQVSDARASGLLRSRTAEFDDQEVVQ